MIVRDLGDAWQVVMQTDHADLSAAFARAWATPLAPSLVDRHRAPRRRLGGLGAVAARRRRRQAGRLSRRRRPRASRLLPGRDRRDHRGGRRTPACSSRCTAPGSTGSATAWTPRSGSRAPRRCRAMSTRSSRSRRRSSAASRASRWEDYELLQLFDRLSLYFCMRDGGARRPSCRATGSSRSRRGTCGCRRTRSAAGAAGFSLLRRVIPKNGRADVLGTPPERVEISVEP